MRTEIIGQWLSSFEEFADYTINPISRPCQNEIFFLASKDFDKQSYYLKIFPRTSDEWGDSPEKKIKRELIVTELIREKIGLKTPIARQILIDDDNADIFLLEEELTGVPFDSLIQEADIPREIIQNVTYQAGGVLARVHEITSHYFGDVLPDTEEAFPSWAECFRNEVEWILRTAENRGILNKSHIDFFKNKLANSYIDQNQSKAVLCHRDFTPQNIILDPNTFTIIGIIDFEATRYWIPEWDLTRVNALFEYSKGKLDLLDRFFIGYIERARNFSLQQIREAIDFYKCFESLHYWLWGWDREFRKDIEKDILRVTNIPSLD